MLWHFDIVREILAESWHYSCSKAGEDDRGSHGGMRIEMSGRMRVVVFFQENAHHAKCAILVPCLCVSQSLAACIIDAVIFMSPP